MAAPELDELEEELDEAEPSLLTRLTFREDTPESTTFRFEDGI